MTPAGGDLYARACAAGAAITEALARDDALGVVAERIAAELGVGECRLYEYRPEARVFTTVAVWSRGPGPDDPERADTGATLDKCSPCRQALVDGACCEVYGDDPDLDPADRELMARRGEHALLSVPLSLDGRVIGCLTLVEKRERRRFSAGEKGLAALLAVPVALVLHNAGLFRLAEEQNRHLASLLDSSRALTSAVTLEDCLSRVCRTAAEALATDECVVYEYDPRRDAIVFRAVYGAEGQAEGAGAPGTSYPLDEYPSDREILRGGEVVQETLSDQSLPAAVRASMERLGEQTCLNVPLLVGEEIMGLLVLIATRRERAFSGVEVELARALGEQAATAIRHARLYRSGDRQNRRLLALLETSRVLVSSLDAAAVLGEVRREVAGLFAVPGDSVVILLRRDDGFYPLDEYAAPGANGSAAVELDELGRRAVAARRPASADEGTASRLIVPLILGEAAEGLLDVRADGGHRFGEDEVELLQILAGQAAAALANADLYRTIERQAITDGLTGLHNHRYFFERLTQEVARAQRYGLPLSLLMVDIDDFKYFNDRYGHPTGDVVLREVGGILTTQLRRGVDFAARYGGEEFVVLLPNTARDGAHVVGSRLVRELALAADRAGVPPPHETGALDVGERIRVAVAASSLPGVGVESHVTVSIGVACFPGAADGPGELVRCADKALYLAKRLGKNRVEVFDG
jgi:diguanylate cyclase (GGDEF)-like protein